VWEHATDAQVQMADPVNTATGNFHQSFSDFVVRAAARGSPSVTTWTSGPGNSPRAHR